MSQRPTDAQFQKWAESICNTIQDNTILLSERDYGFVIREFRGYINEEITMRMDAAGVKEDD